MSEDDKDKISLNIVGDEDVQGSQQESGSEGSALETIEQAVNENDVVLYMKGSPAEPMCGFSARATQILQAYGVDFKAVNVLEDDDIREGIKEFGDWPTIPQLYVDGELLGGSDIMMKMHESGELAETFEQADIDTKVS